MPQRGFPIPDLHAPRSIVQDAKVSSADISKLVAWIAASSPAKRPAPMNGYVQVPPNACLWPVDPAVAAYPNWSGLGERQLALRVLTPALAALVMDQRLSW